VTLPVSVPVLEVFITENSSADSSHIKPTLVSSPLSTTNPESSDGVPVSP